MHDTAFRIGSLAMETYADLQSASVLEIGAQSVNGSLRVNALPTTQYLGIDIEEGEGVDIVVRPGEEWPVEDDRFDLVIATSVFEHDNAFWRTFLQMCRKAKHGGHIYISAPSNGQFHRYPQDYWRFYPDAGVALEALATSEGLQVKLVESFVAEREGDDWNDFCAIFRRGPSNEPLPTTFIWEQIACTNVLTWQSPAVLNAREYTEDQILLRRERENNEEIHRQIEAERSSWSAERDQLARSAAEGRVELQKTAIALEESRADVNQAVAARDEAIRKLSDMNREIKSRNDRIADLESNLRQRQEEISQAWDQAEAERSAKDAIAAELQRLEAEVRDLTGKMRDADEWVYKLAGERRQAEQLCSKLEFELQNREAKLHELVVKVKAADEMVSKLSRERRRAEVAAQASAEQLIRRTREVATLTEHLDQSKRAGELAKLEAEEARKQAEFETRRNEDKLSERFHEMAILTSLLKELEERAQNCDEQVGWLLALNQRLQNQPLWRSLLPRSWGRRHMLKDLQVSGLFDAEGYLERYPDVADEQMDPLEHYLLHGMHEGRSRPEGRSQPC